MRRRPLIAALLPAALGWRSHAFAQAGTPPSEAFNPPLGVSHRALRFPADHGDHPDTHVEWWYVTGWLRTGNDRDDPGLTRPPEFGFQVRFFRSRTDLAA